VKEENAMASARVDRVAIVVKDVDAAAAQLKELFGIELRIFDIEIMNCRVGLCDEGFELVQPLQVEADSSLSSNWSGSVAAIGIQVDDLEASRKKMAEAGFELASEIETPGGVRELYYGNSIAGLPFVLAQYGEEGFMRAIGAEGNDDYQPRYVTKANSA
jgi:hypothetical protein